jgi:phosphoribosylamine--glycine ligase
VNGQLVTSGMYGWTMVATAVAKNIDEARRRAVDLADRIIVPNMRYRRDIGSKLSDGEFAFVEALGLLDPMV